ncbi:cell wall-binding repeat-containing protein, partial [Bacillus safensis]
MKKTGVTLIVLMILTLLVAPFQSAMASSAISVKLSNYIGNKTSMDISTTGEYKLSGSNVAVTKRYDGKNRYEVANSIASAGWKNPSTVVIVSRDAFDHAISVSPLAYKLGAPILYTNIEKLTKTTENQLKKMKPDNILIVGNTKSISTAAEKSIKKYGKVRRISGKDKFEISQKIAKEMGNYKQAVVVGGNSFMNGIAIASYASRKGYPILLTKKDSIPSYRMPSKVIIIGSTKSTGQKVENQIKKTSQVTRISGANRYE